MKFGIDTKRHFVVPYCTVETSKSNRQPAINRRGNLFFYFISFQYLQFRTDKCTCSVQCPSPTSPTKMILKKNIFCPQMLPLPSDFFDAPTISETPKPLLLLKNFHLFPLIPKVGSFTDRKRDLKTHQVVHKLKFCMMYQ